MEERSDALIPDLLAENQKAIQYVSEALEKAVELNIWLIQENQQPLTSILMHFILNGS